MIEIYVPTSAFSMPYFDYLVKNYQNTADCPSKISFHPVILRGYGSMGHANGIRDCLDAPSSSDNVVRIIADSDTVMLCKGWDSILLTICKPGKRIVMGTSYEAIGGFSSGNSTVQTYKNRSTMSWIAIPTFILPEFKTFDTSPVKQANISINSIELSQRFGLPIGYELLRDACWSLPQFLDENGIEDTPLYHAKPTMDALALKTGNDYHEEYQIINSEFTVPFVGHQRGSMKHPFRGNDISKSFYDQVENYLLGQL